MIAQLSPTLTQTALNAQVASLPGWMPKLAFAPKAEAPRGDTLIVIFLRGAADALNIVVPHGEAEYYHSRPTLAIARPDDRRSAAELRTLDLDGFFGFHPSLRPLLPIWQGKQLAIVHACGAPDDSRSHFRAMELMERGVANETGPASGWIGRHLATHNTGNLSPLRAVGFANPLPRSLRGPVAASALKSIADFHLGGDAQALLRMQQMLAAVYAADPALGTGMGPEMGPEIGPEIGAAMENYETLNTVGQGTLEVIGLLNKLNPAAYVPANGALYPNSDFGMALQQIALLIKAEAGLEVAAVDVGGWDTHFIQGGSEGVMAALLDDLAQGLGAFHADLVEHAERISVVVMSEFGRRLQENGSFGTDHGHGSVMLLLGGNVQGGRVHGRWPGLAEEQLVGPGDLAVTTDYRDILAELCLKRMQNSNVAEIFPGWMMTDQGIFRDEAAARAGTL